MEPFFIVGVIAVIVGLVFAAIVAQDRKVRETWAMFARAHGLTVSDGGAFKPRSISGQYQGFLINIYTETRGSGKSQATFTLFSVPAPVPPDLNLYRENFLHAVAKAFGTQDIRLGDEALDKMFMIQGRDENGVRNLLLHPRVRQSLANIGAMEQGLRIAGGRVIVEMRGVPTQVARLQSALTGAVHVAGALAEAMGAAPAAPVPAHISNRPQAAGPIELMAAAAMGTVPLSKQPQKIPDSKLRGAHFEARGEQRLRPNNNFTDEGILPIAVPTINAPTPSSIAAPSSVLPAPEQFGAWGAEAPAPTPAKPASKPEPASSAALLEDTVKRLAAPGVPSFEREQLIAAITGKPCAFIAMVERVDWTSDLSLPDILRSGRTAICKYAGATIAARFPENRNTAIDALSAGAALQVLGVVAGWDDFYGRLLVNASS